jgi:hypothetical protein
MGPSVQANVGLSAHLLSHVSLIETLSHLVSELLAI